MTTHTLFEPGEIRASQSAKSLTINLADYVNKHLAGDWGRVKAEAQAANDEAVERGQGTIGSVYATPAGWLLVITRSDRSATTILRPSDAEAHL